MEPFLSWDVSSEYLEDIIAGGSSNQYKLQDRVTCPDLHLCQQNEESSDDPLDAFNSMESRFFDGSVDYMIAYPFDMVKRGKKTVEGQVTLEDINSRILMPPTRPVRHPVGEFAPSPPCASSRSFGITGKAVVALAKVHTQGRGTITVIRTKS